MTTLIARDGFGSIIFTHEFLSASVAWHHIATHFRTAMVRSGWVTTGEIVNESVKFTNGHRVVTVEVR